MNFADWAALSLFSMAKRLQLHFLPSIVNAVTDDAMEWYTFSLVDAIAVVDGVVSPGERPS